ncbi:MAG: SIS domain-containing protein [Synechococcales bacterium]|nr:SIS domain-containing protein [Synechococcales bacterium]
MDHMLHNIWEQPAIAQACLELPLDLNPLHLEDTIQQIQHIQIIACGSSYHAGLVAKTWFEAIAHLPTQVQEASEYPAIDPFLTPQGFRIFISQSGFTSDVITVAQSVKKATSQGLPNSISTLGITNGSQTPLHTWVDHIIQTPAGTEQAIAATKTFLAQLIILLRLVLQLATQRQTQSQQTLDRLNQALSAVPSQIEQTLQQQTAILPTLAQRLLHAEHCILLGRGIQRAIALEGALKLKETAYLHAEGYSAGDFMHGPIALIEPGFPLIAIALPNSLNYNKTIENLRRIKSYGATVIGITPSTNLEMVDLCDHICPIDLNTPSLDCSSHTATEWLSPLLTVLPLQLLAHAIAQIRGYTMDQPRHLTKFLA